MIEYIFLHIIYTEDEMLLSRKEYACWRDIQDEYQRYKASLGPWTPKEVIDYLSDDYRNLEPSAFKQVHSFLTSTKLTVALRFT